MSNPYGSSDFEETMFAMTRVTVSLNRIKMPHRSSKYGSVDEAKVKINDLRFTIDDINFLKDKLDKHLIRLQKQLLTWKTRALDREQLSYSWRSRHIDNNSTIRTLESEEDSNNEFIDPSKLDKVK